MTNVLDNPNLRPYWERRMTQVENPFAHRPATCPPATRRPYMVVVFADD
jgi:hypothetical protein